MACYRYQGQCIESEIPLTALVEASVLSEADEIDLTIYRGPSPKSDALSADKEGWLVAPGAIAIDVINAGRFTICDGRAIYVEPAADSATVGIEQYLLGTMFALAQMQKSQFCLHAAVVTRMDRGVAFCGDSGEGKSTLAMALNQAGWGILTDDLALIQPSDDGLNVANDGRRLRLWQQSIDALGLTSQPATKVSSFEDKFYLSPTVPILSHGPIALSTVCFLDSNAVDGDFCFKPISGMEVLALLNRHTYRTELLHVLGQQQAHLAFCCMLSSRVSFYRFSRPRNLARLKEMVEFVSTTFS